MKRIQVLDCTLRDGGYINNWKFGRSVIKGLISNLEDAGIDIIECGFIRDVERDADSSVFSSMKEVEDVIYPKKSGLSYAVMIEQRNYREELVCDSNEKTADYIRLTFRRNEWKGAKITAKELISKGYKVCIQPVGTACYDDASLIHLLHEVNEIKPYAFYLVDTLGLMYSSDMRRFFYLIDSNLEKDICLGFHSHNNLQMSFANAQEMINLNGRRSLIIDSSCYGMGRGVGNLPTELLADFMNHEVEQRYSLTPILNVVDQYLMPIYAEQRWGYDLPYFLSATMKCHPNYAAHLIRKETLSMERIEKLLSLIPLENRNEYDTVLMENLYLDMQKCDIEDQAAIQSLKKTINGRQVLIIGPGASVGRELNRIREIRDENRLYVISTNHISELIPADGMFISNQRRLQRLSENQMDRCFILATSNLKDYLGGKALLFDYSSLLGEGDASDNAGAMLIKVLKKADVKKIFIAGFDGFDVDPTNNYYAADYKKALDYEDIKKKNTDIAKQLKLALSGIEYEFITSTKYKV